MRADRKLPPEFFLRDAAQVARDLLGRYLVRELPEGRIVVRLVETEAYAGPHDRASHAFAGRRTPRNESMYLPGGHAYVYRIYGIHFCLNVVTGPRDSGVAVLLRAAEIVEGEALVRALRPGPIATHRLLSGPGNLTRGLGVDVALDGAELDRGRLRLTAGESPAAETRREIVVGPRIGCESAGEAAAWPLRFALAGNVAVSRPRPTSALRLSVSPAGCGLP